MHGQSMSDSRYVYCTFWVEVETALHSCTFYENEQDGFYQSLKPYDQKKYRRMVNNNLMDTIKSVFDENNLQKHLESHARHVERTKGMF